MIYAGDQAIQLPVRDIYDTQIMLASINAARDMYERGQKQMEDFYKKYGDFFSPISSDMDWYDQNVTGRARDFIQNLYNNGVDPLRSAEGRALIQQFVNSVPVSEVNKRKQAAAAAQEYIKARGELEAKGLWNPEYEQYLLGGRTLETWDTARDGLWNRTSPGQYKDLNAATYQWFDKLDKSYLRTERGYDYFGVDEAAMNKVLASQIPGFINSGIGGFHYEMAKRQLQAEGITDPSVKDITDRLKRNIIAADSEVLNETRVMNEEAKQALEWKYDRMKINLQHQNALDLARQKGELLYDKDGNLIGPGSETTTTRSFQSDIYNSIINKMIGAQSSGQTYDGRSAAFFASNLDETGNKEIKDRVFSQMSYLNNKFKNIDQRINAYLNYWSFRVTPEQVTTYLGRKPVTKFAGQDADNERLLGSGAFRVNADDVKSFKTARQLVSNTMGFGQSEIGMSNQDKTYIEWMKENPTQFTAIPRTLGYGAPFKQGIIEGYFAYDIYDAGGNKLTTLYQSSGIRSLRQKDGYYFNRPQTKYVTPSLVFDPEISSYVDRNSARVDDADKLKETDVIAGNYY